MAIQLANLIGAPSGFTGRIGGLGVQAPPLDVNYQSNLARLTNKYQQLSPILNQLPPDIAHALINMDSGRVAQGSAPLNQKQTTGAIQTALTNQQATPEPDRNPLNILGNVRSDLSDILKAIPRLPLAAVHEVQDVAHIGDYLSKAQEAGTNPLAALLQAPGVRLIPGAYVAGNAVNGRGGLQELATHPLMAALDVLPLASEAAGATKVGRIAEEARAAEGLRPRPISAVLTNRLVETPEGTQLARNPVGQAADTFRNETRLGQALDAFGGRRSRDVARARGTLEQRYRTMLLGIGKPASDVEAFLPRVRDIFTRYADEYPMFKQDRSAAGPEMDAARAEFYNELQRNPDKFNPGLVGEIRDLNYDMAKYAEGQGNLGMFDGEWYDAPTAKRLQARQGKIDHTQRMVSLRNEYLNPSGNLSTDHFRTIADEIAASTSRTQRGQMGRALEATLDAYGYNITPITSARRAVELNKGDINAWRLEVDNVLQAPPAVSTRRSFKEITDTLRSVGGRQGDRQATLLEAALARGERGEVTKRLKNLYDRKPPTFPDDIYPQFREDVRSLSRRLEFDEKIGYKFTDAKLARRQELFEKMRDATAPARFQALIGDETRARATTALRAEGEQTLGRVLTDTEAGQLVGAIEHKLWENIPGVDAERAVAVAKGIEEEVTQTWRQLRAAGHDPVFVHKVSPARANQALAGNIGPIPVKPSAGKERVLDLTPGVNDVQVSLTHQAGELLQQTYNEKFIDEVLQRVGKREADLRAENADWAQHRAMTEPTLDFEGHLEAHIRRGWEKFNPEEAGTAWGGVRLDKYKQEQWYIPKAIADNLHRYAKPPSITSSIIDPITKAFRYNVIGLSPSVIINNFFSNTVAMAAESGLTPWKNFGAAREWLAHPEMIPNDALKGMVSGEIPNMEYLSRDAWLKSRVGSQFMQGFNAGNAFKDSIMARTPGTLKQKLDHVVSKSLQVQMWSDNIYRAMQYMHEVEKGAKRGLTDEAAASAAMEQVRRTFVDYTSFTPIERSAMRTLVPFYSYMGHAARFIARYPLDHPLRASLVAHLADAERDRLGALPGSFLSMIPIGGIDSMGKQTMIALRPFDPFGDMSDLLSVSGWLAAMNPIIQTALQQVGVIRGEADLYPTLRYDPQTGRMKAVHGNILSDLVNNTLPRAGLLTAAVGLNPRFTSTLARDPDAAKRQLLSMAGLPRAWRDINVRQEEFKGEVNRQESATQVQNEALQSGNWREALRYPSLRAFYDAIQQLPPETIQSMTPATRQALAEQVMTINGVAAPGVGNHNDG